MIDTDGEAWRKSRMVADILPSVAGEACFALKGGTLHNLGQMAPGKRRQAIEKLERALEQAQ